MNRENFLTLMSRAYDDLVELNKTKGKDYAGDEDALSNFKDAAEQLGVAPEQVWAVYAHKHWSAIVSYCARGQVESEPIEGRIKDLILYGFLLLGLVHDREHQGIREATRCLTMLDDVGPGGSLRCVRLSGHPGPCQFSRGIEVDQ